MKKIMKNADIREKVICSLFLVVFNLRNISQLKIPSIMLDEIGYWASAAYLKGYNWSGVMGNFSSYYSYGYSLLLYVFMSITEEPELMHQLAIVSNVLMIIVSFVLATKILGRIVPNKKHSIYNMSCFLALFYPSVQYHSQVAWSETYLLFMFIISVYMAIRVCEKAQISTEILFIFTIFNLYIIHKRSLGILIIGIIYIVLLNKHNKKSVVYDLGVLGILLLLLVLAMCFENMIYANVYTDTLRAIKPSYEAGSSTNPNDFGGQIGKIKYFFTLEGFYNFIIGYVGKIWYFVIASFGLGFNGLIRLIKNVIVAYKKKIFFTDVSIVSAYILGAYLITAGISAIFMIIPGRWDAVAYGRYTDWIGIIIVSIGIVDLLGNIYSLNRDRLFLYVMSVLLFLIAFLNYAKKYDISDFFASSSPILLYFENIDNEVFIIIMTLSTLAIGILLYLLLVANKQYLASMIAIIAWTVFTNPGIEELIIIERKDWVYPITECIEANGYDSVYYLYSADATRTENMYVGSLQYLLQEMPIHCITDINEVQDENACIIIGYSVPVIEGYKINSYTDVYRIISREEK